MKIHPAQGKFAQSLLWLVIVSALGLVAYSGSTWGAKEAPNLVPPLVLGDPGEKSVLPQGWHREDRQIPGVEASKIFISRGLGHPGELLALVGGPDRGGRVWCQVSGIRPHTDYTLEFLAFRPKFTNDVYFEVEIFGQRHLINQHWTYGRVQPIVLRINSREVRGKTRLVFDNAHPEMLAFGAPTLRISPGKKPERPPEAVRLPDFFPVGIYSAGPDNLPAIRAAGFNAIQSYDTRAEVVTRLAELAARQGLKYLASIRRYQKDLSKQLGGQPDLLGFYIEDEPEGRSLPPHTLGDLNDALKKDSPGVLTAVAMLRPQMVKDYRDAADIFMIDPYPVPHMPMTWLSDCLEEAACSVPRKRLWAVIQAFGGGKWAKDGWPRRPQKVETRCLTYLAVAHGAHGIFYFSYPEVSSDPATWEDLQGIVRELQGLQPWLVLPNLTSRLRLEMTSPFKVDAAGRPAVHFCEKQQGLEHLLVLVNVINHPVSFYLQGFPQQISWVEEKFLKQKSVVLEGNIREELGPYEVRIYKFTLPG
ncbi:MAG: hypothetical protein ACYC6G_11225 [Desulfobaccales bacterium]